MNIEDLEYLKQTFEFIRNNTELIDHNRDIETYGNNMMNCENIISRELSERKNPNDPFNSPKTKQLIIADVRLSLPRPIEAYNMAHKVSVGEYCDWYLEQEKRGNEARLKSGYKIQM